MKKIIHFLFGDTFERRYWRGRIEGWKACESMVMKRAREEGYDLKKVWEDLLQ